MYLFVRRMTLKVRSRCKYALGSDPLGSDPLGSVMQLEFEYDLSSMAVHDWWTDLSGKGYVGKALRAIKPLDEEGNARMVETRWRIMAMTMTLLEKLTLASEEHWIWQPTILGIAITDDFRISNRDGRTVLTILSTKEPRGMTGRLAQMMLGSFLDRMMADE